MSWFARGAGPLQISAGGLAALLLLAGCATVELGGSDEIPIVSEPPGAVVSTSTGTTSDGPNCRSPCKVFVDRRDDFTVTLSKAGFGTQTVDVKAKLAGSDPADGSKAPDENRAAFLADKLSGALFVHVPNPVVVKLAPAS